MSIKTTEACVTVQEEQELFPWSSAGGSAAEHICTTGLELQRALQRQKAVGKRRLLLFNGFAPNRCACALGRLKCSSLQVLIWALKA